MWLNDKMENKNTGANNKKAIRFCVEHFFRIGIVSGSKILAQLVDLFAR